MKIPNILDCWSKKTSSHSIINQRVSFVCFFPLQASSFGKWRSSESRRLSTSVLAMMWPPFCLAASLWSTQTPRTSLSLMKETGWSDDQWGKFKKKGQRTNIFRCPNPQNLQSTPHPSNSPSDFFPFRLFYLVISVSLSFVSGGDSPRRPCLSL